MDNLPDLEVTPAIGLLRPLLYYQDGTTKDYFTSPKEFITWRAIIPISYKKGIHSLLEIMFAFN